MRPQRTKPRRHIRCARGQKTNDTGYYEDPPASWPLPPYWSVIHCEIASCVAAPSLPFNLAINLTIGLLLRRHESDETHFAILCRLTEVDNAVEEFLTATVAGADHI